MWHRLSPDRLPLLSAAFRILGDQVSSPCPSQVCSACKGDTRPFVAWGVCVCDSCQIPFLRTYRASYRASHTVPRVSEGNLIGKRFLGLRVKFLRVRVDDSKVGSIFPRTQLGEMGPQSRSQEFAALRRTGRTAVQGRLEVLGQSNKGFNVHGAMVRPSAHSGQAVTGRTWHPRAAVYAPLARAHDV